MNTIEIALNYSVVNHEHIKTNKKKTVFKNTKTGRRLTVTENSRSIGIWIGKTFLPLSKIECTKEIPLIGFSKDLQRLLSQL